MADHVLSISLFTNHSQTCRAAWRNCEDSLLFRHRGARVKFNAQNLLTTRDAAWRGSAQTS